MDLRDFVAASLEQIVEGMLLAQKSTNGAEINAKNDAGIPLGNRAYSSGTYGNFTLVDFDVAVTGETSGKGGANLSVFGVGFEGGGEHKAGSANRLTFSIPIRLPYGDETKADGIAARRTAKMAASREKRRSQF